MKTKTILGMVLVALCLIRSSMTAEAKLFFEVKGQCEKSPCATLRIKVDDENFDGFDIYKADPNGEFQYLDYVGIRKKTEDENNSSWNYSNYDYEKNDYTTTYVIEKKKYVCYRIYTFEEENLQVDQMYTYRVDGYHYEGNEKRIVDSQTVTVTILRQGPTILSGKRNGKLGSVISWSSSVDADGYRIYMVKDYDEASNYLAVDTNDLTQYTMIKEISNPKTTSIKFNKLMNGVTYTYRICSYKNQNGTKLESTMSEAKSILMNYYTCDSEDYAKRIKRAFGSEKKKKKNFSSSAKASKQMKRIKIKVWDYKKGKKGKKVTRTKYIVVNKKLAPSITQMFKEIYKCKEKQVINDIGCYSYRSGEHMYGMAIDINPNENYMIDNGTIISGSYWKPKKDPYSIPANCETVRIMKRYGFYRGEWGNRKDYMHFSYFGT